MLLDDYCNWAHEFTDYDNGVDYRDISNHQKDFILYCNDFQLQELIDIKPQEKSSYVRSSTERFDDEMELDQRRVKWWLFQFGLLNKDIEWNHIHISGHTPPKCDPAVDKNCPPPDCKLHPTDPNCPPPPPKCDTTKEKCCPDGSKLINGKCVCPTGSSLVNGKCEPTCPKGFKLEHGICERTIIRNIIIRESNQLQQQPPKPNSLIQLDSEQICKELGDQACISSLHNFKLLFIHTTKDSLGYWGVTGEVQNISPKTISQLQVGHTRYYLY